MKPNVLLINCDDLGYGDLPIYGNKLNKTPFINQFAQKGTVFTNAYATSSICTPSRAGLMTGCYQSRVGLNAVLFPQSSKGLNTSEYTMGNLFKDNGYKTKIIGKWHLGDQKEFLPTHFGFDEYYGLPYSNDMGRQLKNNGEITDYPPLPLIRNDEVIEEQPDQSSITERYTEEAIRFLRENKNNNFFLYLAHTHVHLPLYAGQRFIRESENGNFGACVAETDWSCGAIVKEIEKLGLDENTIIILTSDNGSTGRLGASNYPLKGTKFTSWEGGNRIPFVAVWKNHIKENAIDQNIISHLDLLPTFANILDSKIGKNKIDGIDITKTLLNGEKCRDEFAYFVNRKKDEQSLVNIDAIRKGDYKLYFKRTNKALEVAQKVNELYNLKEDISEENNIYDMHPEIVKQFEKLYKKYSSMLGDFDNNIVGSEVRPYGEVENPVPLTQYDENNPYIISYYDLTERG